ncbi:SRPBCC family protein [Sanguibacter suaedae]|uniref:SRPBCC family protein n=1 Tax=Sanguibacter suaedae TaxID=2795737 RepID=A0A934IB43_9MICO|nr:SRPBCC family protein [Sanguibacter suaedae]MBI9114636.1 SRPBCC family protein [Sanguibacter suaedae]
MTRRPVHVSRVVPLPADEAFALLADPRHHGRWIPLTSGTFPDHPPGPLPVGAEFTMVSTPGIVDRMRVTTLDTVPPRDGDGPPMLRTTLRKVGPLLLGVAGISAAPVTPTSSRVTWWEDVHLAGPVPAALTRAAAAPALLGMTTLALWRAAREIRRGVPSHHEHHPPTPREPPE